MPFCRKGPDWTCQVLYFTTAFHAREAWLWLAYNWMTNVDWNWFYNYVTRWLPELLFGAFGNSAWKNEGTSRIKIMTHKYENDVKT